MAVNLVSTILPVLCVTFILQIATCLNFQSTAQQYHQTTHSSGGASEPDNQTSTFKDLHEITDSSSPKYGFPGVTKINEFIAVNQSGKEMTESHENNGGVKRTSTFRRSNSENVSTFLLKILPENNKVAQQRPGTLLSALQTDNREMAHLQDKLSNTLKQRLAQATTKRKQNRKRKRDMGLLYLFPDTNKDNGKSIHLHGNENTASKDKTDRTQKSRLYLFSNLTLVNIPLSQETNSQSRESKTAIRASRENKTVKIGLPRRINKDESNRLDHGQNFKKNLYNQLTISKFPTVQNKRRKSALISTLDKSQDKNGLVSYLEKSYRAIRPPDLWRLEKPHKRLPERSEVRIKQDLRSSSNLNLAHSDKDDEGIVKKLSDSDKKLWSPGVMKKTSLAFTDLDGNNVSSKIEKKYTLKQRKADREKRRMLSKTKIDDKTFSRKSYFPERSGRMLDTDDLTRTFNDFQVFGKEEPDDKLLDFIISSNKIKPEDFDIHALMIRRRRAAKVPGQSLRSDDDGKEEVTDFEDPARSQQPVSWKYPYQYIPGFLYDEDTRTLSHGVVNTGMENINIRISDDLFRAHIDQIIDRID